MKLQDTLKGACAAAILAVVVMSGNAYGEAGHPQQEPVVSKPVAAAVPASPSAPAMTADDLSAYLDGLIPMQLKRENIAAPRSSSSRMARSWLKRDMGLPMSRRGRRLRRNPVPSRIDFQALHLDRRNAASRTGQNRPRRDINDYLDFKIPATYPKPITCAI